MTAPRNLLALVIRFRAVIALVLLSAVFAILSPDFISTGNLTILLKHVAINAILAIGMTFVVLSGGIDLSVGSIAGVTGMIAGLLLTHGLVIAPLGISIFFAAWIVILISLAAGMGFGAVNGLLIARLNVPPFIATLGVLYGARGTAMLISNGGTFPGLSGKPELANQGFQVLGSDLLGLPTPIWITIGLAIAAVFLTTRTTLGRHVYAVGGNERAARLAGVRVGSVKLVTYVVSGFCAALVGLIIGSQLDSAYPATGETFELNAIAAVVLGGTSLMGGRGTIGGTLIGALVIGVLANGLVLLGVSEFWQMIIKGAVIVGAVIIDQANKKTEKH
ncbi:MAG: inner-rane translocator [Caulobacteraceae bacterium]|nr:inner-rane translocator [Caulobacteraceae bacterium]